MWFEGAQGLKQTGRWWWWNPTKRGQLCAYWKWTVWIISLRNIISGCSQDKTKTVRAIKGISIHVVLMLPFHLFATKNSNEKIRKKGKVLTGVRRTDRVNQNGEQMEVCLCRFSPTLEMITGVTNIGYFINESFWGMTHWWSPLTFMWDFMVTWLQMRLMNELLPWSDIMWVISVTWGKFQGGLKRLE